MIIRVKRDTSGGCIYDTVISQWCNAIIHIHWVHKCKKLERVVYWDEFVWGHVHVFFGQWGDKVIVWNEYDVDRVGICKTPLKDMYLPIVLRSLASRWARILSVAFASAFSSDSALQKRTVIRRSLPFSCGAQTISQFGRDSVSPWSQSIRSSGRGSGAFWPPNWVLCKPKRSADPESDLLPWRQRRSQRALFPGQ